MRLVRTWHDMLDDVHATCSGCCPAEIGQNANHLLIIPIVKYVFEQIGVGCGCLVKHVAGDVAAAVAKAQLARPKPLGFGDHFRQLEHDSSEVWISDQKPRKEVPMPASDI